MSCSTISAKLPNAVIDKLKACEGVVLREDSVMNVIEIVESIEGQQVFKDFLITDAEEVDPILSPGFGHPLFPYIPVNTQVEVYNLLETFRSLTAANIVAGGFPHIPAVFPVLGGMQYHHAKIAIQAVQEEMQTAALFAVQCPGIVALPSGNTICDLTITYANIVIVTRIRKF
mmetsp:Transcript_16452/g.27563  ORF Transcript_16452/g.27563 Transcript_16452/m.27563 type:complete len:173 (+) Transcript_16452:2034-2552(+)